MTTTGSVLPSVTSRDTTLPHQSQSADEVTSFSTGPSQEETAQTSTEQTTTGTTTAAEQGAWSVPVAIGAASGGVAAIGATMVYFGNATFGGSAFNVASGVQPSAVPDTIQPEIRETTTTVVDEMYA